MVLEIDSATIYDVVRQVIPKSHAYSTLIISINDLMGEDWNIELCFIYRETNRYLDKIS